MNQVQLCLESSIKKQSSRIEEDSSPPSYLFEMPLVPLPTVLQAGQAELRPVARAELPGTRGDAATVWICQPCR